MVPPVPPPSIIFHHSVPLHNFINSLLSTPHTSTSAIPLNFFSSYSEFQTLPSLAGNRVLFFYVEIRHTTGFFHTSSHHCFHCPHFSCLKEFEMKVLYVTNANSSRSLASYLSCLHWHLLHDSLLVMYLKLGSWVHSKNLWWPCNEGPLFWSLTILIIITGVIVTTRHHIGFEPVSRHGKLWNPSNCYTNPHNKDTGSSKENSSVTLEKWRFLTNR